MAETTAEAPRLPADPPRPAKASGENAGIVTPALVRAVTEALENEAKDQLVSLVEALHAWMQEQRARVSGKSHIGAALSYMLRRWDAFARFLEDGRICLSNNAAERSVRAVALGRKAWLFAGSDRGGDRAAVMYSLIYTCKLNGVDPLAWLTDVLARIADHKMSDLPALLPWKWTPLGLPIRARAA